MVRVAVGDHPVLRVEHVDVADVVPGEDVDQQVPQGADLRLRQVVAREVGQHGREVARLLAQACLADALLGQGGDAGQGRAEGDQQSHQKQAELPEQPIAAAAGQAAQARRERHGWCTTGDGTRSAIVRDQLGRRLRAPPRRPRASARSGPAGDGPRDPALSSCRSPPARRAGRRSPRRPASR